MSVGHGITSESWALFLPRISGCYGSVFPFWLSRLLEWTQPCAVTSHVYTHGYTRIFLSAATCHLSLCSGRHGFNRCLQLTCHLPDHSCSLLLLPCELTPNTERPGPRHLHPPVHPFTTTNGELVVLLPRGGIRPADPEPWGKQPYPLRIVSGAASSSLWPHRPHVCTHGPHPQGHLGGRPFVT